MSEAETKSVVVLGASNNPDRYSFKAICALREHGYAVIPIHPALDEIQGIDVVASVKEVHQPVDTVSLYVNPSILGKLLDDLVDLSPRRVLFNPGTESAEAVKVLEEAGIQCENACTLVLLQTGQF
tara:strand:+ start:35679 stop:36056 length:378 start_codon:yes stop_codon:yes gene_type:complete